MHQLQHALPSADRYLRVDTQTIQWRSDAPFTLDVADFEHALERAAASAYSGNSAAERSALEPAVQMYHGELLPNCYDEWLMPERERLHQAFLAALDRLIKLSEQQRDYPTAITYAERLLRDDPLHEATYRQLMRLHARNGDRASALDTYRTCAAILERELGVEPSAATREAYEQLQKPERTRTRTNNLPAQPTSFIGRAAELEKLAKLLVHPHCRLITIVGPGGIGKSRLALQAAAMYQDSFVDRVWPISLAPISDPALVTSTIALALGVRETDDRPLISSVVDYLREKQILLLLDNFEQVTEAATLVRNIDSGGAEVENHDHQPGGAPPIWRVRGCGTTAWAATPRTKNSEPRTSLCESGSGARSGALGVVLGSILSR